MRKFFLILSITVLLVPLISATSEADIIFPIPELGNCVSKEECIKYCDDLSHRSECEAFAEKHNLKHRKPNITFPVTELGNCNSEAECKTYCDDPTHMRACLAFAKEHQLIDEKEIEDAEKVLPLMEKGETPGGCKSRDACETYCSDESHFEECLNFFEKAGFIRPKEAEMIRKVGSFAGPGGCKGEECRDYCEKPENTEACVKFAEEHGFISHQEAEMARKFGISGGPGGCKGKEACETYCQDTSHFEECLNFAEEHGFMDKEDAERMRKAGKFVKEGPGGCQGKEACQDYCEDSSHSDECINFAEQNGFMTHEEAEQARKFKGFSESGPGGCKGREECEAYCHDESHFQDCINFAHEKGFMSDEEFEKAKQFNGKEFSGPGGCKGRECEAFCNNPENMQICHQWAVEHGYAKPMEEMRGEERPFDDGKIRGGPGGCSTPEECRTYCQQHPEECRGEANKEQPYREGEHEEKNKYPERIYPQQNENYPSPYPTVTNYPQSSTSTPCKTEEECRRIYCEKYPDKCGNAFTTTTTSIHEETTTLPTTTTPTTLPPTTTQPPTGSPTGQIIAVLRIFQRAMKA